MRRFYYSAIRNGKECEGIIRAESIDSAKKQLVQGGHEEITLSILSSVPPDFGRDTYGGNQDVSEPPPP